MKLIWVKTILKMLIILWFILRVERINKFKLILKKMNETNYTFIQILLNLIIFSLFGES